MRNFWSLAQRKFFHLLNSALVIEAHADEGGSFSKQYRKGNPEKTIIH
jgi:hypothetical protein